MRRSKSLFFLCALFLLGAALSLTQVGCDCSDGGIQNQPGELKTNQPNNSVLFTNITLNKSSRLRFKLFNDGGTDVTIESAKLVDNSKVFSIVTELTYPLTLKPGEANGIEVTVQFLTKKAGEFRGSILFASSDAFNVDDNGNFEVKLRHRVLNGDPVFLCGRSLDFGAVPKGKTKEMECELKNRGNAELNVTSIKYVKEEGSDADFVWVSPKAPFKLKPNNEQTIKVKIAYKPSDYPPVADKGAFVLIGNTGASNEKDAPRIRVLGRTAVALIEIVPIYPACKNLAQCQAIDKRLKCSQDAFSKQTLCRQDGNQTPVLKFPLTSKGKTTKRVFEIRSIGDLPLTVDKIEPAPGTSLDFSVVKQKLQMPFNLDPKEVKEIVVEYSPSDDKEDKGQLVVSSNAGNKPKAPVILEAASRGCNLEVTPGSRKLKFPAAKSFKITVFNVGNESCLIKEVVTKSGKLDPFTLVPQDIKNRSILPNGQLDFLVKFSPKSKAKVTDAVIIKSSDPDEPEIEIVLEGELTGTRECELAAKPASLNFGLVPVGRSRQQSVVVENKGWGDCKISSANVVGTNPSGNTAFGLTSRLRFPLTITSGATVRLDVSYTPPASRPGYEGNLTLQSNDSVQSTFNIKLQGSSGNLCLEIVPSNMDFGSTKFGCATPKRDIEVFNLGATGCSKTIRVTSIGLDTKTSKEFRIMSAPTVPLTINAGQSFKIGMSYKAKDLGTDTGVLNLGTNIPGQNPIPVPLVGEGIDTDEQKDVFKQLSRPKTDILFVVDDSCSMGDEQASLAKNFQSFINWAIRLNVDYQIGVTTTDVTGRRAKAGCLRGSVKIVKNSTPNPVLTFQTNVKVGTSGSATEKGLEAAYKALSPPVNNDPQCNRGFYRQDASLSLIFVSDEPDYSSQSVQFYISFFRNLKGFRNLDFIRASAVVGPPPSGCRSPGSGSAQSGPRYWAVAKQLKGVQTAICGSNWSATLTALASITFGYQSIYSLSRQADPKTILVKVNGTVVKESAQDGWTYDNSSNSVNFSKSQLPPPGATIVVEYKAICLP